MMSSPSSPSSASSVSSSVAAAATGTTSKADVTSKKTGSEQTQSTSSTSSSSSFVSTVLPSGLRLILLDLPLWIVTLSLIASCIVQHLYKGPIQILRDSLALEGTTDDFGFLPDLDTDITYYNRQCTIDDVTSTDSNDLIIPSNVTKEQAADIMMTHGAVLIPNVLQKQTASKLRAYLETRHEVHQTGTLPWQEKFWGEIGRLSLGLGVEDDPIIGQALEEVGNHALLKTTIEGILGDDPAIVEISTLTTLHGAEPQGIHTDSDYFGSSLLYSRTFLHSYTMFMALQDTTSLMGATTICPGTHMCANEDLEQVCLGYDDDSSTGPAFEASSNGQTGKHVGVLHQGDGMMFNQNIWHRGPRNNDPQFPINRVMFIVTFVSRRQYEMGDVRIQGMGTYYYQRWNMWGHTYQDLKTALVGMQFPWSALKALGLYQKGPHQNWGVSWLEHFTRQLANHMDFYAPYELPEFVEALNSWGIPAWLQGTSDDWNTYIIEMMDRLVDTLHRVHGIGLVLYLVVGSLGGILLTLARAGTKTKNKTVAGTCWAVLQRVIVGQLILGGLGYGLFAAIQRSDFFARIDAGEIFWKPFPNATTIPTMATKTTALTSTVFPERMDVLVGSRFDADFLGIYNHVLDYHPGNQRFDGIVQASYNLPHEVVLQQIVQQPIAGVTPRFLQQDWATGYWTLHDNPAAYVHQQMQMIQTPWKGGVERHLRAVLADGRFGMQRDTVLAQRFTPLFVERWQTVLFAKSSTSVAGVSQSNAIQTSQFFPLPNSLGASLPPVLTISKRPLHSRSGLFGNGDILQVGDRVYAETEQSGRFYEATIQSIHSEGWATVAYALGGTETVPQEGLKRYRPVVQGDQVESEIDGQLYPATIVKVHPLGTYDLLFDDGERDYYIPRDQFRLIDMESVLFPTTLSAGASVSDGNDSYGQQQQQQVVFQAGSRILGNFQEEGEWFEGIIARVKPDGTYDIQYADGDQELSISPHLIRPLMY